MKKSLIFVLFLICVGFVLGTITLRGPLRALIESGRDQGRSAEAESVLVRLVIVLLVAVSLLAAGWLSRKVNRTSSRTLEFGLPALSVLLAGGCVGWWLLSAPESSRPDSFVGSRFTFGAYPSEARISQLAAEGYSGVISLLHPAVVPFETRLIEQERSAVVAAGLEFVHAPMLPWVSDNRESLATVETIVERGHGRYYVHCLLGKDRVRIVERWIREIDREGKGESGLEIARTKKERRLRDGMLWERGGVAFVGEGIFVTPQPAASEYMSYLLAGVNGRVISLLDPNRPEDRAWLEEEQRILEGNGLQLVLHPIPIDPYDGQRVLDVVDRVRRIPGQKVVHAFLSLDSGRSPSAEAFVQALYSGLPPLPPALFSEPLALGRARVIAPNVAFGPRPRQDEFAGALHRRGVRKFVYLGDARDPEARQDEKICREAGLEWRALSEASELLEVLAKGGPWYLYGPRAHDLGHWVAETLGPALPPRGSGEESRVP